MNGCLIGAPWLTANMAAWMCFDFSHHSTWVLTKGILTSLFWSTGPRPVPPLLAVTAFIVSGRALVTFCKVTFKKWPFCLHEYQVTSCLSALHSPLPSAFLPSDCHLFLVALLWTGCTFVLGALCVQICAPNAAMSLTNDSSEIRMSTNLSKPMFSSKSIHLGAALDWQPAKTYVAKGCSASKRQSGRILKIQFWGRENN